MFRKIRSVSLGLSSSVSLFINEKRQARLTIETSAISALFECSHKTLRQLCSTKCDNDETPFYSIFPAEIQLPWFGASGSFDSQEKDDAAYHIIRMLKQDDPWNWSFVRCRWRAA